MKSRSGSPSKRGQSPERIRAKTVQSMFSLPRANAPCLS